MDRSVVVIEPSNREGGLTTGGLGQTDIGNKQVIGGLSREFYRRIAAYYANDKAWKWQQRTEYRSRGQSRTEKGEPTMWTFEPSAALHVYRRWLKEADVLLIRNERLDRDHGVERSGSRIVSLTMESGRQVSAEMFIDATYEGDLMAASQVSYTVGREANSKYGESLNGVQTQMAKHHQFVPGVDPYRTPGDPKSGLLPFIDPNGPGEEGEADRRIQAYCFRMCLTDHPENRIPFHKPASYDETWYELLLRNFEAGANRVPLHHGAMPNRKTDTNNNRGFSTDFIGQNYDFPEASYDERDAIVARHRDYQQGLMWTLANHPRVPEKVRSEVSRWGMCRDEFVAGSGWQGQLYIREARRMVGYFVMTQNHCQHRQPVPDPIGMGAYTMDSHHVQRHVDGNGNVRNEGDVQVGGFPPYPISYRAIVPRNAEAQNLLVPVCLSASHMAFGSIRMEPVFMVLGQSAATAASQAIEQNVPVQEIDYARLRARLERDGQVLAYKAPPRPTPQFTRMASLDGIVVDDEQAQLRGAWTKSTVGVGVHLGYQHDGDARDGFARASFVARLPQPGEYEVEVAYVAHPNRATRVPITIEHADGTSRETLNQRQQPKPSGLFSKVGRYRFGEQATVTISNRGTDGYVIIDAVRWLPVDAGKVKAD